MKEDGKEICEQLKELRKQIASDNGIPLEEHECHYEGPCNGTCPRCDGELHYLEKEVHRRGKLGKVAIVAGMTLGLAASCTTEGDIDMPQQGGYSWPEDSTQCPTGDTNADCVALPLDEED